MDDMDINALVEPVLRDTLGASRFERSEVRSGTDHDGDPVLYVTVHYRPGQAASDVSPALLAVLQKLRENGEERIPLLRPRYPDDELGSDESEEQGSAVQ
jgi:hypothetical protein